MKKFLFLLLLWSTLTNALEFPVQVNGKQFFQTANINEGYRATYSAVVADYTPYSAAQDMACLRASSTKNIRITFIRAGGDATAFATVDMYLYKRTAVNTGGTSANITSTLYDSTDPAATGTVVKYTALPSSGTGTLIRADHVTLPASATAGTAVFPAIWEFGTRASKAFYLRKGTNEQACLNFGGNAVPSGAQLYMTFEWTEE